jgi:bile acid:Na+ symporter, BASS family
LFNQLIDNYAAYEYAVASAQLFLAMLGMGALLTTQDFLLEAQKPKGLVVGLGCQWLMVPLIALAFGWLLPIPVGIALGLVLLASVPGGTTSNILTLFGRGNIALSISLTSITTVAALVATPLLLKLMAAQYLPADFRLPSGRIALDIFFALILPLAIGMLVRRRVSAAVASRFSKISIRISLSLIVVMAIGAGGGGRLDSEAYGNLGLLSIVALCLVVQLGAYIVTLIAGMKSADRLAVIIEAGFRNVSLAVAVKAVVFPAQAGVLDPVGDAVLFTIMVYGGVSMILCLLPVFFHRRFPGEKSGLAPQV